MQKSYHLVPFLDHLQVLEKDLLTLPPSTKKSKRKGTKRRLDFSPHKSDNEEPQTKRQKRVVLDLEKALRTMLPESPPPRAFEEIVKTITNYIEDNNVEDALSELVQHKVKTQRKILLKLEPEVVSKFNDLILTKISPIRMKNIKNIQERVENVVLTHYHHNPRVQTKKNKNISPNYEGLEELFEEDEFYTPPEGSPEDYGLKELFKTPKYSRTLINRMLKEKEMKRQRDLKKDLRDTPSSFQSLSSPQKLAVISNALKSNNKLSREQKSYLQKLPPSVVKQLSKNQLR